MTLKSNIFIRSITMTAVLYGIAVVVVFALAGGKPASAEEAQPHVLAAELLIVRGDLSRLNRAMDLSPAHISGLQDRIKGALGLLPWMLHQAGDNEGADKLRTANGRALRETLDQLIARHPLNLAPYAPDRLTAKQRREAFAIHDTYCAGCHDDAGDGDADTALPARDLFVMARTASPETFLARLINGVKGDDTLLFANPLTTQQLAALWSLYRE